MNKPLTSNTPAMGYTSLEEAPGLLAVKLAPLIAVGEKAKSIIAQPHFDFVPGNACCTLLQLEPVLLSQLVHTLISALPF